MVDFAGAIKLPFTNWKKLGIGTGIGVLTTVPVISILASFVASGYGAFVANSAMKRKKAALPEWASWGEMFLKGVFIFLINLAYLLIPLVVTIFGAGLSMGSLVGLAEEGAADMLASSFAGAGIGVLALSVLLWVAAIYFLPMAVMNFVSKGKLSAAFSFREVAKKAFRSSYLVAWLFSIVYAFLLSIVAGVFIALFYITYIGPFIISGLFTIVLMITLFDIYGQAYAEK